MSHYTEGGKPGSRGGAARWRWSKRAKKVSHIILMNPDAGDPHYMDIVSAIS
jgi:hypothetical protein